MKMPLIMLNLLSYAVGQLITEPARGYYPNQIHPQERQLIYGPLRNLPDYLHKQAMPYGFTAQFRSSSSPYGSMPPLRQFPPYGPVPTLRQFPPYGPVPTLRQFPPYGPVPTLRQFPPYGPAFSPQQFLPFDLMPPYTIPTRKGANYPSM